MVSKFINEFEETCEYYFEHGWKENSDDTEVQFTHLTPALVARAP